MNILFYGNCQTDALVKIVNITGATYHNITCHTTEITELEFYNLIKMCDIIVLQPIHDGYRNKHYLSTNYIINTCNNHCKVIIFDSCYFKFYHYDMSAKIINNELFLIPYQYHYQVMINCYINGNTVESYINDFMNNIDLVSKEELELIAHNNLMELNNRYNDNVAKYKKNNVYIVSTYQYIKDNYKDKLLFYTYNHPTKYVLQYIAEEIAKIINMPYNINYDIDPLNFIKGIIYKCIQKVVNFNINNYLPLKMNETDIVKITQTYYDTYKNINIS